MIANELDYNVINVIKIVRCKLKRIMNNFKNCDYHNHTKKKIRVKIETK